MEFSGIQVAGGLVGQQNRRMVHNRPRDGHALLLAAGESVGLMVQAVCDAEHARALPRNAGRAWTVGRR